MFAFIKKIFGIIGLFSLIFSILPLAQVFADSTEIFTQLSVKNYTQGTGLGWTVNADPGDTVMFHLYPRNDGQLNAQNLKVKFSPFPLEGGLEYPSPDTPYRAYNYNYSGTGKTEYIDLKDFDLDGSSGGDGEYLLSTSLPPNERDSITHIFVKIPENYSSPIFSLTATPTCDNCTFKNQGDVATVHVNVKPIVTRDVIFMPNTIVNNEIDSTTISVVVNDKNGLQNISSVSIDLTPIIRGIKPLYDDGFHNDGKAGDGQYATTVTTLAAPGTYSDLKVTVLDNDGNTSSAKGRLIVQKAGLPVVNINSTTRKVLSNLATCDSTLISWQTNQACGTGANQGYKIELGGNGIPGSGKEISSWNTSCQASTPVKTTINVSQLDEGENDIYIYVVNHNGLGYNIVNLEKDINPPKVSGCSFTCNAINGKGANVTWRLNENAAFNVKLDKKGVCDGKDANCGIEITGDNINGIYTNEDVVNERVVKSIIKDSDIEENKANKIFIYATDDGGNVSSYNFTILKDFTPPVNVVFNVTLQDNDTTKNGVDGYDFTVNFSEPTNKSHVTGYNLYIYKWNDGFSESDTIIASLPVGTHSWTGNSSITKDSKGRNLDAKVYRIVIVTKGEDLYENSGPVYSGNATITGSKNF
ncbi:hypothetical protein GMMP15_1590017 [Candidatus Magnetomoraceae bacterium gMMP-15]